MKTRFIKTLLFGCLVSLFCLSSATHAYVEPEAAQKSKTKGKTADNSNDVRAKGNKEKTDEEKDRRQPEYAKDRLIVKYKKNTGNKLADVRKFSERRSTLKVDGEHRRLKRLGKAKRTEVLQVPEGSDIQDLAGLYSSDPNVEFAEPDFMVSALIEPNDPSFSQLWGMHNIGQAQNGAQSYGIPDADINAPAAWDITTGDEDVVVAVIDTGIFYTHPDLTDNMWVNPGEISGNGIDDDNNGYIDDIHGINTITNNGNPMDDQGHGTHVSGIIGARGNNTLGITGVNWNVSLIGCKFLSSGLGSGYLSDAIECMDYLLDLKTRTNNPINIVVSNNSWGGGGYSQALSDAIFAHQQAGILFVAAAGNASTNSDNIPAYPAAYSHQGIISVAATDWKDHLASFSNYGKTNVDVAAPGVNILSTVPVQPWDANCRICTPWGYQTASGTSMAAPHVTGLIALLKAQNPARNLMQLRNLVVTSGQPLTELKDITVSGRRIRAADDDGTGGLTCDNQQVMRKLKPNTDVLGITPNSVIDIQILQMNCDSFGDELTVTVAPDNEVISLKDDGQDADAVAGDGVFSARHAPHYGDVFSFPDGSEMSTTYTRGYRLPVPTTYSPINPLPFLNEPELTRFVYGRRISEPAIIQTDFPIPFGGVSPGYTQMYVNSNGTISFDGPATGNNSPLPHTSRQTLIAPFWDNLASQMAHNGWDTWEVHAWPDGESPHRAFVVDFQPMSQADLVAPGPAPNTTEFQVIFFEDSSDVLFNYEDTSIGAGNDLNLAYSNGASATVGIQVAPDMYKHHSMNKPTVASGTALRWTLVDVEADAGKDATAASGEQAWLDGSESSGTGGVAQYQWTQVSGAHVTLNNANTKRASFIAPAKDTLEFELTITDATGATASDRVIIKTSARPIANAGPDQFPVIDTLSEFSKLINLNGLGSVDTDGQIVHYQWEIPDEPQITFLNPNNVQTSLEIGWGKTLRIQLTVTDDTGLQSSAIVVIDPNARPISKPWASAALYSPARTAYTGQTNTLEGSAYDPDGQVVSYQWQQVSGPTVQITNANSVKASFVAPAMATQLSFRLVSTDNEGATSSDQLICFDYGCFPNNLVSIRVIPAP